MRTTVELRVISPISGYWSPGSETRIKQPSKPVLFTRVAPHVPRFFFHLYDDLIVRDEEGKELPDLETARSLAASSARHIACTEVMQGHLNLQHRIEVEDEVGAGLFSVRFNDVIRIIGN